MASPSDPIDPADDPSIQELVGPRPWLKHDATDRLLIDAVPLDAAMSTPA